MTDWTTCRVVRDRDGDLWFRGCDSDDLWTANTNYPDVFLTTDEVLTGARGPNTVSDLGNVHLGRRIKYEGPGGYGREGVYQGTTADYLERDRCNMHVGGGYEAGVPLDTPCEVVA